MRHSSRFLVAASCTAVFAACTGPAPTPDAASTESAMGSAVTFREAAWVAPREADIPTDSMGASIKRGLYLLRFTKDSLPEYVTSNLNCVSCHQDDGIRPSSGPLTGSHARFPKYMGRSGAVISIADRVNYCFTRSLAGNALPVDSREMTDMLAYIAFLSKDIPVGTKIVGAEGLLAMKEELDGDATRGKALYTEKTCITCHGPGGAGIGVLPPLWGPQSFSIGASMARMGKAASFISHNMPQTAPGSLTAQEAYDLAAYITSQPRPDSPGKENDFPAGGAPKDQPYDSFGHKAFRPPPLLKRTNPERALVPNPPVVSKSGGKLSP